jgi:hypothetical protein
MPGSTFGTGMLLAARLLGVLVCLSPTVAGAAQSAAATAKSAGPLKIVDALFEDEEGFPVSRIEVKAGGEAVLTFRVEGFDRLAGKSETGLPESWVRLQYEVELRDPSGVLVQPVKSGNFENLLGPQDDKWRPLIHWTGEIPAWAPTGNYPIHIRVRDSIADRRAEQTVSLRVVGESVSPASGFQAQQVEFARSDDGPWTPQRYFSLHEPIHVRFKVVGYRVSPRNQVWVEQDWEVLDADGKVLVSQPNAVNDQVQAFYPPRYLATTFRLDLEDPKPGAYTLRITLRDKIGDQTATVDSPFNLRP